MHMQSTTKEKDFLLELRLLICEKLVLDCRMFINEVANYILIYIHIHI